MMSALNIILKDSRFMNSCVRKQVNIRNRAPHDQTIVHLNPARSVSGFTKVTGFAADFFTGRDFIFMTQKNLISYDDFIESASVVVNRPSNRSSKQVFGYFYTSGTTYGRKSIILTNENRNAAVIQQQLANPLITNHSPATLGSGNEPDPNIDY